MRRTSSGSLAKKADAAWPSADASSSASVVLRGVRLLLLSGVALGLSWTMTDCCEAGSAFLRRNKARSRLYALVSRIITICRSWSRGVTRCESGDDDAGCLAVRSLMEKDDAGQLCEVG